MADTIADSAELMVAPFIGNILVMINKACSVEDDMIVNMIFVNVCADHVLIFSFFAISLVIENSRSAVSGEQPKLETNSFSSVLSGFVM